MVKLDLSAVVSSTFEFYFEVSVMTLHNSAAPQLDGANADVVQTFTLSSPTSGESLSGAFLSALVYAHPYRSRVHGFPSPLFARTTSQSSCAGTKLGV